VSLHADVVVDLGSLALRVTLDAVRGEVVAIVGANGAGKTTLLRALAGLVPGASLTLDGRDLSRSAPEQRPIGMVFQDRLLFEHLSALDNVAFGVAGRRRDRHATAVNWLRRVGLAERAHEMPGALSGGQAQRVALARALAREPRLLLLDEPLTALDPKSRTAIRRELHRHLDDYVGVTVLVTHDPVDAAALADRTLVLDAGGLRPAAPAEVFGTNLVRGLATAGTLVTERGTVVVGAVPVDGPAIATIPPHALSLHRRPPEGTPRNVWAVTIERIESDGERAVVHVGGPLHLACAVTRSSVEALALATGQEVWAAVKATEIELTPI
jgi:molybdate transport system ATP-binding protein